MLPLLFVLAQAVSPDSTVRVFAGAEGNLSDQSSTSVQPFALVASNLPVYFGDKAPFQFHITGRFGGAPSQTVNLGDITTFKALDFNATAERNISAPGEPTSLWIGVTGGFQTKVSTSPPPLDKTAKRLGVQVKVTTKNGGLFSGSLDRTSEFAPYSVWAGFLEARVPLQGANGLFWLGGRAGFSIGQATLGDIVQVYVAVATKNITIASQSK